MGAAKVDIKTIAKRTIWITEDPAGTGYIAIRLDGSVVARSKYKSQVEYKVRHDPVAMLTVHAICTVVNPGDRQPARIRAERNRRWRGW